jgi:hypothetical protein
MEETGRKKYSIDLNFSTITFPPIHDILVLGRKSPQGKKGLSLCFELLAPGNFEMMDIEEGPAEAVLINKAILTKLDRNSILELLKREVFPYLAENEILNVKLNMQISVESIKGMLIHDR